MQFKKEFTIIDINRNSVPSWNPRSYYGGNVDIKQEELNNIHEKLFVVKKEEFINTSNKFKDLPFSNNKLKNGDKLFVYPHTDLPRHKIRDNQHLDLKLKRSINDANILVIDKKAYEKSFESHWRMENLTSVNINKFKNTINSYFNYSFDYYFTEQDILDVSKYSDEIYISYRVIQFINNLYHSNYIDFNRDYDWISSISIEVNKNKTFDALASISILEYAINNNYDIMTSSQILNNVTPNTIITDKLYTRFNQMLKSDLSSVDLAMEMLANCDIKRSAFNLIRLIQENKNAIRWSKSYNNVNFKAFRNLINEFTGAYASYKDYLFENTLNFVDVINILGSNKLLTKEHLDYYKEDIRKDFTYNISNKLFKVAKIEATELLSDYLKNSAEYLKTLETEEINELEENEQL